MLEYSLDGKKVVCEAIHGKGRVGQVVVLDHINFGQDQVRHENLPDFYERKPLAAYPMRSTFTIVEVITDNGFSYLLRDPNGKDVKVVDAWYLYDLTEWLAWQDGNTKERLRRKERRNELLQGQVDLLANILKASIRIVTQEEAEQLGLTQKPAS